MKAMTRVEKAQLFLFNSLYCPKKKKKQLNIRFNKDKINPKYFQILSKTAIEQIIYGGSSSGKSYFIAQMILMEVLKGRSVLIARKYQRSIKKSIFSELKKMIYEYNLKKFFRIRESDMEIISKISSGSIMFVGLDNSEKIKSITPAKAKAFDLLIVEEATEISHADYNQLCLRMRGRSKFKKKRILLFNPIFKRHWIYKRWFKKLTPEQQKFHDTPKLFVLHTTYKDNNHLDKEEIKTLEEMKHHSPYHYMVYALGMFGVLGKRILPHVRRKKISFEGIKHLPDFIGGDFGYTNDPTGVIFTKYDAKTRTIYIYDEVYKKQLTNNLVAEEVNIKIGNWELDKPETWWDSQEPKSITELKQHGLKKAREASKGDDSIRKGLDWLQQHNIIVCSSLCTNFLDESELYVWKEEDGEPINKPIDKFNHLIDALRYAYWRKIKGAGKIVSGRRNI